MQELKGKIYIGSSMVYELLVSMFRLECHEQLLPQDRQKLKYVPEKLTEWVEKSREKLTEDMKKDINVFFNYESFLGLSLVQLAWQRQCHESINDFFDFLDGYPAKELVHRFFNTGYGPEKTLRSIDSIAEVKDYLDSSSLPEVERWKLLYFCYEPEETKKRFLSLIKGFYSMVFAENIDMLSKVHAESIRDMEKKLAKDPYGEIERLINFDLESAGDNDKIMLFPSYYYNIASLFSYDEEDERLIYVYGIAQPELKLSNNISSEEVLAAIKILCDENRVKAIEILKTAPCYGYELSQKLGISSSTVSHHLSLLSSIGAISPVREENKVYYEVNKDNIKRLLKHFEAMLT